HNRRIISPKKHKSRERKIRDLPPMLSPGQMKYVLAQIDAKRPNPHGMILLTHVPQNRLLLSGVPAADHTIRLWPRGYFGYSGILPTSGDPRETNRIGYVYSQRRSAFHRRK